MSERVIRLDEGYQFGLGIFETIAVERNVPLLLKEHLERLERSMQFLQIAWKHQGLPADSMAGDGSRVRSGKPMDEKMAGGSESRAVGRKLTAEMRPGSRMSGEMEKQIRQYLACHPLDHGALKLMVSAENTILIHRPNPYTAGRYEKGFRMDYSRVLRNETSPLIFHKTLNYGDCILEKRRAAAAGYDELIFLNTKGQLCEGTTTNLFLIKSGKLYTPKTACGMLPGIMRNWVLCQEEAEETVIFPEQVKTFDECFVTNSLMGIMPVVSLGGHEFLKRDTADRLLRRWQAEVRLLTQSRR